MQVNNLFRFINNIQLTEAIGKIYGNTKASLLSTLSFNTNQVSRAGLLSPLV